MKEIMKRGREFIAANLAACCKDELDWQNTGILRDGALRMAGAIFSEVDNPHSMAIAQSETAMQAMQIVAQNKSYDDPIGEMQAEARQTKLDDFVRAAKPSVDLVEAISEIRANPPEALDKWEAGSYRLAFYDGTKAAAALVANYLANKA